MYKYEKKARDFPGYSADYRDFYGLAPRGKYFEEKETGSFLPQNFKIEKEVGRRYSQQRTRFRGFVTAVLLMFFSVPLIFLLSYNFFGKDKPENLKVYDDLIWPLVMQNPEPFSENSPPNEEIMLRAAIWSTASKLKDDENNFDEIGNLVAKRSEVKSSFESIFGEKINFDELHIKDDEFLYEFIETEDTFLIKPISADECYIPRTANKRKLEGEKIALKVEYLLPESQDNIPEKAMTYILKKSQKDKYYVTEVQNV